MPTFGAFYLGREVSNSDKTFPDWAAKELLDTIQKKGKGQQDVVIGAMYRGGNANTQLSKLVATKWHSSPWLIKE